MAKEATPAAQMGGPATATISEDEAYHSPTSITCSDIETQTEAAGHAIRVAANALAGTGQLRHANHYQTAQRLIFALNDLCKGRRSFLPTSPGCPRGGQVRQIPLSG